MRARAPVVSSPSQADAATPLSALPRQLDHVVRSSGEQLPRNVRAPLERRFGHSLDAIRIHRDASASAAAQTVNAEALTMGEHIVFGKTAHGDPLSDRALVAHEVTHVLQHRRATSGAAAATDWAREDEAHRAGAPGHDRERFEVRGGAPAGYAYFNRVRFQNREFEVGDVILNDLASRDVRRFGVLLPGPDQAHLLVHGNRLGYEVTHTTPDDPFRWNIIKEIVDTGHVKIFATTTGDFEAREVTATTDQRVRRNLMSFLGGGLVLPRLSLQRSILAGQTTFVASPENTYDHIVYSTGRGGRGFIGSNSLAHELLGHLWLAMKGSDWRHGRQVTGSAVTDAFGRPYGGSVNDYISNLAGASGGQLQSPTQRVGPAHLTVALNAITRGAGQLHRGAGNAFSIDAAFNTNWEFLSQNYEVLAFSRPTPASTQAGRPPGAGSAASMPTPASIVQSVATFARGLNADQRFAFDNFLSQVLTGGASRRTNLARDVRQELQRQPSPAPSSGGRTP